MGPRLDDWRERLRLLIQKNARRPFRWGVFDCHTWSGDVYEALHGVDVIEQDRLSYFTQEEFIARLKVEKASFMVPPILRWVALEEQPKEYYRDGDLLLIMGIFGPTVAISADGLAVGTGPKGLVTTPASLIARSWKM